MNKFLLYINLISKLGFSNVLYVCWYRISIKSGIRRIFFPQKELSFPSDFYRPGEIRTGCPSSWKEQLTTDADKITSGHLKYYSRHWMKAGNPPDWFLNPFNGIRNSDSEKHWTQVPEFGTNPGDIKNIWEASRFEWVVTLAKAYSVTGDSKYHYTLNSWMKDWAQNNPVNTGPNWRCGQEASIRVLNLVLASLILKPTESLNDFLYVHLERIGGNIRYAIAQDNNHGITEAAGLFIGGSWLASVDAARYDRASKFAAKGRKWLENRVEKLLDADGSFSQHSVNYHRLLVDTLTFTEYFRKRYLQVPFSAKFYERANAAISWLYQLTDEGSGGAPNLGANDGSLLNHMHGSSYKDFRPSLQLAGAIFSGSRFFAPGDVDEPLYWLNEARSDLNIAKPPKKSLVYNSGYVVLRNNDSWCLLRFPWFRFRPSHNDVFHFDLWHKGVNILCDAGSYSYNPSGEFEGLNLKSVHCHNTVAFDDEEQMPELSRFLMGNWLKPDEVGEIKAGATDSVSWEGSYTDSRANKHIREINILNNTWSVKDTLSGDFRTAEIGFNINDPMCSLNGNVLNTSFGRITIPEGGESYIEETYISEYYNEVRSVQRLKIIVSKPGVYITLIEPGS